MDREDIIIRDFRPEDYSRLYLLWQDTGLTYPERGDTLETIQETLQMGGRLLVMADRHTGDIIGSSWMTCDGRRIFVHHFGIRTDCQNQGLGTLLAEECMAYLRTQKKQVKLEVHKDNHVAVRLYKKSGFLELKDYRVFMIRAFLFLLLFLVAAPRSPLHAQPGPYSEWDTVVLVKANTGAGIDYLSDDEKRVILLTNLARTNGPLFAETFLKRYLEMTETPPNNYTMSLVDELMTVKDLPLLIPEKDLYIVARSHAIESGKSGQAGHKGFSRRYKPMLEKYNTVGENCDYGNHSPLQVVMRLLIDEDISDLGHRHNMLDESYNSVGVSIKPHKEYDYNCVMSFGTLTRSYLDVIR
jgi:ribosomal protein S18 acetylase RimI-like enzyme